MSDQDIEQKIQEKGLTAPRVTPEAIRANIVSEHYFTGDMAAFPAGVFTTNKTESFRALSCLTFCVLVLRNGFTVTGESACASPENFNAEIGREIARENAILKMWPLMGYELKQRLHEGRATSE